MNSIENNIVLIHGGIIADSNIPLVPFFNILMKTYNTLSSKWKWKKH